MKKFLFIPFLFSCYFGMAQIQIGTQNWMTNNLNTEYYRNGDSIPQVTDPTKWESLTTGAWCYYNNDPVNGETYGKLYNWYAVNDPRGLAPKGWHIPTDEEWATLATTLGGEGIAGGKLKKATGWTLPNSGANEKTGFAGLPGGGRDISGEFISFGNSGYWWSAKEYSSLDAWFRGLNYGDGALIMDFSVKADGFSVRCIKDDSTKLN